VTAGTERTREPESRRARRILLVDCDQFFVQCARLADPEGAGKEPLLLVGGSADHRGVITSASYETRRFGVRSGMPTARALRLCPRATVVPVPRRLCLQKSREVRAVLDRFSPIVEPASIDEAYLDMSGTEALHHGQPLADTARAMRAAVLDETRISVSIGGGPTRVVAKLAAERAKPAGILVVPPDGVLEFMLGLQLADIPGIGPVFAAELARFGLVTVEQALLRDEATLEAWFGGPRAHWLFRRVHGIDGGEIVPDRQARSMSREETFASDIDDDEELETELLALAVRLGADLRRHELRARTITVKLRDADFRTRQSARSLDTPIESDRALFNAARERLVLLRRARKFPARLVGIAASGLEPAAAPWQLEAFEDAAPESERDRRIARTADELRRRFGPDAIKPGRLLGH
jgi:DNA polymerase-4